MNPTNHLTHLATLIAREDRRSDALYARGPRCAGLARCADRDAAALGWARAEIISLQYAQNATRLACYAGALVLGWSALIAVFA